MRANNPIIATKPPDENAYDVYEAGGNSNDSN
jgi:hypothetical protein